jgi:hypothetical protein
MLVYLDSANLMDICRDRAQIGISELRQQLAAGLHQIVFSFDTLIEVAAPLHNGQLLEVRRELNQLDDLPHIFVNEARIRDMEMREALAAFEQGREYEFAAVRPFASRLDRAIDVQGLPQYVNQPVGAQLMPVDTDMLVNRKIWDVIIYEFRQDPETFNVYRRLEQKWIATMKADRMLENPPALSDHFVTTMSKYLDKYRLQALTAGVEPFARWIYDSPSRCPGIRLTYEAYHCFRKNLGARARASDITDLQRIIAVPYVDFFVTDGAMLNYCRQAVQSLALPYRERLGDFATTISRLGTPPAH